MIPAIAFLKNEGADQNGRTLMDYVCFNGPKWEECHDHMQWAFPTRTKSAFNPNAPTIPDDFVFDGDEMVTHNIDALLTLYLASLGIYYHYDPVMGYTFDYPEQWSAFVVPYWAYSNNHNMLRITRVIECLGIFEMDELRNDLSDFFLYTIAPMFHRTLNSKTVAFWSAAKDNKLHRLR